MPITDDNKYPEHDKLRVIQRDSHTIGEFIEWLGENGYYICERRDAESATPKRYISVPEEGSRGSRSWVWRSFNVWKWLPTTLASTGQPPSACRATCSRNTSG